VLKYSPEDSEKRDLNFILNERIDPMKTLWNYFLRQQFTTVAELGDTSSGINNEIDRKTFRQSVSDLYQKMKIMFDVSYSAGSGSTSHW
jgi:hypothetical protein